MPERTQIRVGDSRAEKVVDNLTRSQIVMYAGASGDYNPVHTDEVYVTQVAGHPTVFAHGMLTMGATGKVLTDWVGNGRLTHFGVRFVNLVRPGDTLTATATVEALRLDETGRHLADFSVVTTNQHGLPVVVGQATAEVDP
ncbi:MaoC/PaaZ C-terminal domain-containing protein [Rhodococcus sp. IEGM 1307]|uniref:MaoC/PaaZ C-terminal domain-containing protein n=1 Tax=Rhodococcus sp. IEGM 1307 TaxID=3047091 RepID=UPI0024B8052F|nr:MaoC/PaaZ C-terminal domain-containing protein [Rhodococcus sp. IEGM 1307]MDI9979790.1 MaoC/PaaZ C-terminal domain-containing protein [Rhodococcus sp. IEGM 1307]